MRAVFASIVKIKSRVVKYNRVIVTHSEYRLSGPDQMVQHAVGGVPGAVRGRIRGLLQERRDRRS